MYNHPPSVPVGDPGSKDVDDWDTDPDYVNDVTEKEQRWGSKSVPGSGRGGHVDMEQLRREVKEADAKYKLDAGPKFSYGYGGKFGVENDRMDKTAVGHSHIEKSDLHCSQKDYLIGFGGKFGIQSDSQDRSAPSLYQEEHSKAVSEKLCNRQVNSRLGCNDTSDAPAISYQQPIKPNKLSASLTATFESISNDPPSVGPTIGQRRIQEEKQNWSAGPKVAQASPSITDVSKLPEIANQETNVLPSPFSSSAQPHPCENDSLKNLSEPSKLTTTSSPSAPLQINDPLCDTFSEGITAVALYDYIASEDDELTFDVGESITEIEKGDSGWWKGVCRDKVGFFPCNYVQEQ